MGDTTEITTSWIIKAAGTNDALRLIFGYAMVSKVAGERYHDVQEDHAPEDEILKAALDFAQNSSSINDMHTPGGADVGRAYFVFPMTEEVAKALHMTWTPEATAAKHGPGLILGAQLSAEEYALVKKGERAGFSIEGTAERHAEAA